MTKILKNNNQNTLSWGRIDHFCNILEPRNWEDLNFENFTTNLQKIIQERAIETVVFRWQLFATCKRNIGVAGCVECSFLPPPRTSSWRRHWRGAGINSHAAEFKPRVTRRCFAAWHVRSVSHISSYVFCACCSRQQESAVKMAAAVPPMLRAICDYCARVYGPVYGLGCLQDDGNTRRQCLARLLQDIQFKWRKTHQ